MPSPLALEELPVQWPGRLRPDRLRGLAFQTPYLAGDVTVVADRLIELRAALPGIQPYYAVKANPAPEVITALAGLGIGFQAGSAGELQLLLDNGVEGEQVLSGNTIRTASELRTAAAAGVWRMAFDSEAELRRIATEAPGTYVYLQLRVEDALTGAARRPIGARSDEARRLLALAGQLGLIPYGLSFHLGSQRTSPAGWHMALRRVGRVMQELLDDGIGLAMVDVGGGFPARYLENVAPIHEFGATIGSAVEEFLPYRPDQLICEPGRFLVAESSVLVSTVLERTRRDGVDWLVLDAGVHQGLTGGPFPIVSSVPEHAASPYAPFNLAGPSSDPADVIACNVTLPSIMKAGDAVMFGSAGAYTLPRATNYNGLARPRAVFV